MDERIKEAKELISQLPKDVTQATFILKDGSAVYVVAGEIMFMPRLTEAESKQIHDYLTEKYKIWTPMKE